MGMITGIGLVGLGCLWLVGSALRTARSARGTRIVVCPRDGTTAAVDLDTARALLSAPFRRALRVGRCSRWPDRDGCSQGCLAQIAAAPDGCRVEALLSSWYRGDRCAICGLAFEQVDWRHRPPAFLAPDGSTRAALDVPAEQIREALAGSRPVCFICDVIQTLRRERPDLMVEPAPPGQTIASRRTVPFLSR